MNTVLRVLQLCAPLVFIYNQGLAQIQTGQLHLRQVSDEEFNVALDSVKRATNSGYVLNVTLCHAISETKKKEILRDLRNGIHADLNEVEIANYAQMAFAPGQASVQSDQIIACISEPDVDGVTQVRTISGDLGLNPRQREERRQAMIELGMDATEFPKTKDSCYFYWLKDTILANGNYLHFGKTSTELNIEWGNSQGFIRGFPETFDCSDGSLGIPDFDWATDEFMGLRIGCGTQCWANYVLPMNPDDSIQFIWFPVSMNLQTKTLAHIDEDKKHKIILTQLDSGEQREVTLDENCSTEGVGACLEEVRLTNNELFIEYADWVNAPPLSVHLVY